MSEIIDILGVIDGEALVNNHKDLKSFPKFYFCPVICFKIRDHNISFI